MQDSEAAYANEVADLRQQLHNSSLHVDTFLNSVTDRLAPIMRMLHENISPRSGTIQECDEQKDEPDGDEVSSGSAQHLILIHLDIIQHASAYYHDLLVYLIGKKEQNTCFILLFSAQHTCIVRSVDFML